MNGLMQEFLITFGIDSPPPTDFPSFIYWLCTVIATVIFIKIVLQTVFGLYKQVREVGGKH